MGAFAAVYISWGSTFLAIRYAIETLPPFLMAGARFLIAGAILFCTARLIGAEAPKAKQWGPSAIAGALLLLIGNGGVVLAEQRVPSGVAALAIATEPLWIGVLDWLRPGGKRPSTNVSLGLFVGFLGALVLIGPSNALGAGGAVSPVAAVLLMFASFSWALGSLYSRSAKLPSSPLLAAGMQMLCGGVLLLIGSLLTREWTGLDVHAISFRSIVALSYLIVFGALIGYTCYGWIIKVSTPALASTYAYVNPVIAVVLGWLIGGEAVSIRTVVAAGIIVLAVVLITTDRRRPVAQPEGESAAVASR